MGKRVTIMLDEDIAKKLRDLQARQLKSADHSVSFSSVLNDVLRKELK